MGKLVPRAVRHWLHVSRQPVTIAAIHRTLLRFAVIQTRQTGIFEEGHYHNAEFNGYHLAGQFDFHRRHPVILHHDVLKRRAVTPRARTPKRHDLCCRRAPERLPSPLPESATSPTALLALGDDFQPPHMRMPGAKAKTHSNQRKKPRNSRTSCKSKQENDYAIHQCCRQDPHAKEIIPDRRAQSVLAVFPKSHFHLMPSLGKEEFFQLVSISSVHLSTIISKLPSGRPANAVPPTYARGNGYRRESQSLRSSRGKRSMA